MTSEELTVPPSEDILHGTGLVISSTGITTTTSYEWGQDSYVDQVIAQFPVDTWSLQMQEWWSWALYYTKGAFQPLIQSLILCCGIKAESGGDRYRRSGYVNAAGVLEDSKGLFQMYRFGAGARYVPELNGGIDLREVPHIQFDVMVPKFNSNFITGWNSDLREAALAKFVCGHSEGSDSDYWGGYAIAWNVLTNDLPWKDSLKEGF